MSHAERHPAINLSTVAPERPVAPPKQPETGARSAGDFEPEGPKNKNRKKTLFTVGAVGLAGALVAGGAWLLPKGNSEPPVTEPVPTEPAEQPGESPEQPGSPELGEEYTVEALQLPTGLTAAELGELIIEDRLNQWMRAGVDEKIVDEWLGYNGTIEAFSAEVSERYRETFAVALFGENYKENPNLDAFVKQSVEANAFYIQAYLSTVYNENSDAAYEASYSVDPSAVNETPTTGGSTLEIPYTAQSNSDLSGGAVVDAIKPGVFVLTISTTNSRPTITQVLSSANN